MTLRRTGRATLLVSLFGIPQGVCAQHVTPPTFADSLSRARQYTQWFFEGQVDSLWAHLSPDAQGALGSQDRIREIAVSNVSSWGREVEVIATGFERIKGRTAYSESKRFSESGKAMATVLIFDRTGEIVGWYFGKAREAPKPDS